MNVREALRERDEVGKDLMAFKEALRVLEKRLLASKEYPRVHLLEEWVGAQAAVGTLMMAVTSLMNLYKDYQDLVLSLSLSGDSPNEC